MGLLGGRTRARLGGPLAQDLGGAHARRRPGLRVMFCLGLHGVLGGRAKASLALHLPFALASVRQPGAEARFAGILHDRQHTSETHRNQLLTIVLSV